jgi:hypothetical protein
VQAPPPKDGSDEHWSVLLFESLSAGVVAVLVGLGVVMAIVGVYVIVVWPLTFWDLSNTGLEKYSSWAYTALWSVFGGASIAGYWCFSGAAFKNKPTKKSTVAVRPKSTK